MTPEKQILIAVEQESINALIAKIELLTAEVKSARIQPEPKTLRIREYAKLIGKGENTVRKWIREGQLEVIPGTRLIPNPNA